MKKRELVEVLTDLRKDGFDIWQPLLMLDIYDENEEVPKELENFMMEPRSEPQPIIIMMGTGMREKMDDMLKNFIDNNNSK